MIEKRGRMNQKNDTGQRASQGGRLVPNIRDAQWIWTEHDADAEGQIGEVRVLFTATPDASWTGFADTLYTLVCNGQVVGVGPTLGDHRRPFLTRWELGPFLREGANELLLQVWFEGRRKDCCDAEPIQAGVFGWLESDRETIPTGPRWEARHLPGYAMPGPAGWRGFASHRLIMADLRTAPTPWRPARVLPPHPERLEFRESPIPPLSCERQAVRVVVDAGLAQSDTPEIVLAEDVAKRMAAQTHASMIRPRSELQPIFNQAGKDVYGLPQAGSWPWVVPAVEGDYYLTLDCGRMVSACVAIEVECPREVTIDVGYGEALSLQGRVDPRTQGHSFADRLVLPAGRQRVRLPHDRAFRYLQLTFSDAATLHDLQVESHLYPHGRPLHFACSDPTLNAIRDMCLETLQLCSLTTLVDNARRERQGWGGPDLVVVNDAVMHAFGDARLVAKKLDDFCDYHDRHGTLPCWAPGHGAWRRGIPAHDLWFPAGAWRYVLFSGDRQRAERLLAVSEAVLNSYDLRKPTGGWKWAEWNLNAAEAICTWEVLLAIQGWRAVTHLRRYLGLPEGEIPDYSELVDRLWHPYHQALAQGTRSDGELVDFCGQLDNALALQLGVLRGERAAAAYRFCAGRSGTWPTNRSGWQGGVLGERVRHDPRKPVVAGSPLASQLCAETMFACGRAAEAIQYLRYNFGAMLDEGEGGAWESWPVTQAGLAASCYSQSFGAGVAATLVSRVLGVTFLEPGGRRLAFHPPRACGLTWVEGTVQTAAGPARFRWNTKGEQLELPPGVVCESQTGVNGGQAGK